MVKEVNKEEALNTARGLIEEAVAVATEAGIDPSSIVEPHCRETPAPENNSDQQDSQELRWHDVTVTIDDTIAELFEMSKPDGNPEQEPAFRVTRSTADFVQQDFKRYGAALERIAENWREEKARFLSEEKGGKK